MTLFKLDIILLFEIMHLSHLNLRNEKEDFLRVDLLFFSILWHEVDHPRFIRCLNLLDSEDFTLEKNIGKWNTKQAILLRVPSPKWTVHGGQVYINQIERSKRSKLKDLRKWTVHMIKPGDFLHIYGYFCWLVQVQWPSTLPHDRLPSSPTVYFDAN